MIQIKSRYLVFAALAMSTTLTLSIAGCKSDAASADAGAKDARAPSEPAKGRESYVMAFLVTGKDVSEKTPEMRQAIQAAHMENIGKLVDAGKMVIAGPFRHPSPDDAMRGIFVFDTREVAKAREWTETDPAVQAGVLGMELSVIRTETKLGRALEIYQESLAKTGGDPSKDEMRGYAVVLVRSAESAQAAFAGLREAGKIVFEGELEGSARGGYVAVLDAKGEEETNALLAPIAAGMGEHAVFPWWASVTLLELKN